MFLFFGTNYSGITVCFLDKLALFVKWHKKLVGLELLMWQIWQNGMLLSSFNLCLEFKVKRNKNFMGAIIWIYL